MEYYQVPLDNLDKHSKNPPYFLQFLWKFHWTGNVAFFSIDLERVYWQPHRFRDQNQFGMCQLPMFLNVLRDFSRPHWVDIVYEIKGSEGLSVGELGKKLGMSYMGVKQHCVELEKKGYLDTWRRPRKVGRPEKTYRLTDKVAPLFPGVGEEFSLSLLKGVKSAQGETAVDRLLYQHFQHESGRYSARVKGETVGERAESLAKIRSREGRRSEWSPEQNALTEYHDPMALIAAEFPSVHTLEEGLVGTVIGAEVTRRETRTVGLLKVSFELAG